MKSIAIIPARYGSTRFPGKPLAELAGKPILQHVYERVRQAACISEVYIATDDQRIEDRAHAFGAEVVMTDPAHHSGTDRCAEVADGLPGDYIVVNIQGDEPFIDPRQIDQVSSLLCDQDAVGISTLARRLTDVDAIANPNIVKVVMNAAGRALYFSRSPIPFLREVPREQWVGQGVFFKHLGIYGFRRQVLLDIAHLPPGRYEQLERLEQLRWLEAGYAIQVGETDQETLGIDTPQDLERAIRKIAQKQ